MEGYLGVRMPGFWDDDDGAASLTALLVNFAAFPLAIFSQLPLLLRTVSFMSLLLLLLLLLLLPATGNAGNGYYTLQKTHSGGGGKQGGEGGLPGNWNNMKEI